MNIPVYFRAGTEGCVTLKGGTYKRGKEEDALVE